jgi:hypothetical protein
MPTVRRRVAVDAVAPLGGMGWDVGLSGNVSILVHTAKNCDFKWENNDI